MEIFVVFVHYLLLPIVLLIFNSLKSWPIRLIILKHIILHSHYSSTINYIVKKKKYIFTRVKNKFGPTKELIVI